MKIQSINTIKYTPISFKAENTPATVKTTSDNSADTFESSAVSQANTTTVNKVITSFKSLFTHQPAGKSKTLSEQEISDLIFSRNLLL